MTQQTTQFGIDASARPGNLQHVGKRIPGEPGIWVFIVGDLTTFAVFFLMFAMYRRQHPEIASDGHEHLHADIALLNTVLLLIGSYLVAVAMSILSSSSNTRRPQILFGAAAMTGVFFIVNKVIEYRGLIAAGQTMTSNEYFTYYYAITGLHLIHVVIGVTVLTVLAITVRGSGRSPAQLVNCESGCSYWHMVDLLWLIILPLFYVMN